MRVVIAVAWLTLGLWLGLSWARSHRYVNSLPASAGNSRLRRRHHAWLAFGVLASGVGLWHLFAFFARQ
jgi:hypothetical protein